MSNLTFLKKKRKLFYKLFKTKWNKNSGKSSVQKGAGGGFGEEDIRFWGVWIKQKTMAAVAVGFTQAQLDTGVTVPFPGTIEAELDNAIDRRRTTAHGVIAKQLENMLNSILENVFLKTLIYTYENLRYIESLLSAMNGVVQRAIDGAIPFRDLYTNRQTDNNTMAAFLNAIDNVFVAFGQIHQLDVEAGGKYAFQRDQTRHTMFSPYFNDALDQIVPKFAQRNFTGLSNRKDNVLLVGLVAIMVGALQGDDAQARLVTANTNTKLKYLSVYDVDLTQYDRQRLATECITKATVGDMETALNAFLATFPGINPVIPFAQIAQQQGQQFDDLQELKVICACVAFHSIDQDIGHMRDFINRRYLIKLIFTPSAPANASVEDKIVLGRLATDIKEAEYPYIPIAISIEEHDGRINAATAITNSLGVPAATSFANDTPFPNLYDVNVVPAALAVNATNREKLAHFRQTKDYEYRAQEYLVDVELTLKQLVPRSNPEDEYGYVEGAIDYSFSSDAKTETVFKRGITIDFTTLDNFNGHFANNFAEINHIYDYLANIQGPLGRKNDTITLRKSTKPTALFKVTKDAANALLTDPAAPQPDLQAVLAVEGKVIEDANGDNGKFQFLMQNIDYAKLVQFADVNLLVDQILAQRRGILTEAIFKLRTDQARLANLLYFTDKQVAHDALLMLRVMMTKVMLIAMVRKQIYKHHLRLGMFLLVLRMMVMVW